MNLVVLGATGGTGRLVVEQALAAGHTVTALVRSPEKLATSQPNVRVVTGSATDPESLERALEGADAVISTLGGGGSVIADSTSAIVAAARQTGVRRVVVLSSWIVERDRMNPVMRLATGVAMGASSRTRAPGSNCSARATSTGRSSTQACLATGRPPGQRSLPNVLTGACRRRSRARTSRRICFWPPPAVSAAAAASGSQVNLLAVERRPEVPERD